MTTVEDATAAGQGGPVRTLLRMRVREGCEAQFEQAWRTAAVRIAEEPGNVRQELMRDAGDPRTFLITADWTDAAAVDVFGRSSSRETLTAALRDLREDASRNTYEVLATIPGEQVPEEGTA
jgi:quinol monooxygenase YgiN